MMCLQLVLRKTNYTLAFYSRPQVLTMRLQMVLHTIFRVVSLFLMGAYATKKFGS